MTQTDRNILFQKIIWDYNIPVSEVNELPEGKRSAAGHFDRSKFFIRIIESFPWFTVIELLPVAQVKLLLEPSLIKKLKSPELCKNYEFIYK